MRVFVSEDGLVLVTVLDDDTATVATRSHPDGRWGPPVVLHEERS